mgnify:FL=1
MWQAEEVWVQVIARQSQRFTGQLLHDPYYAEDANLWEGDVVTFGAADIAAISRQKPAQPTGGIHHNPEATLGESRVWPRQTPRRRNPDDASLATVRYFLLTLSSLLTQYDQRISQRQPNTYRLGHLFGALQRTEDRVQAYLDRSDPEAMDALKHALAREFIVVRGKFDLPPVQKLATMIDAWLARGERPSCVARRPTRKRNPRAAVAERAATIAPKPVEHYRVFHGVDPNKILEAAKAWVPGELALVGEGVDVGYGIRDKRSTKDGWYVHTFGRGVKVFRRAKRGEKPSKVYRSFPKDLMILGYNLGYTYRKGGKMTEVKGGRQKWLAVTPDGRTLAVIGSGGVEIVMTGGDMRVEDWIRN